MGDEKEKGWRWSGGGGGGGEVGGARRLDVGERGGISHLCTAALLQGLSIRTLASHFSSHLPLPLLLCTPLIDPTRNRAAYRRRRADSRACMHRTISSRARRRERPEASGQRSDKAPIKHRLSIDQAPRTGEIGRYQLDQNARHVSYRRPPGSPRSSLAPCLCISFPIVPNPLHLLPESSPILPNPLESS